MCTEEFVSRTVVRRKDTGETGIVCPSLGILNCNGPDEVSVVYAGSTAAIGTDRALLEVLGPEEAIADFVRCGAGRGKDTCIFLAAGAGGPSCERFGPIRWNLIFRTMRAERNPEQLFPDCQLSIET